MGYTGAVKRAVVLQHTLTEGPERVAEILEEHGLGIDVRHVYLGDTVPARVDQGDVVIAMGGPMGVGDVGDPRYPFLGPEIAFLREAIARDRPVLGICLGAQLLAAAAGARVYPNTRRAADGALEPAREVGWGYVDFAGNAARDPALAGLRARELRAAPARRHLRLAPRRRAARLDGRVPQPGLSPRVAALRPAVSL